MRSTDSTGQIETAVTHVDVYSTSQMKQGNIRTDGQDLLNVASVHEHGLNAPTQDTCSGVNQNSTSMYPLLPYSNSCSQKKYRPNSSCRSALSSQPTFGSNKAHFIHADLLCFVLNAVVINTRRPKEQHTLSQWAINSFSLYTSSVSHKLCTAQPSVTLSYSVFLPTAHHPHFPGGRRPCWNHWCPRRPPGSTFRVRRPCRR